MGKPFSRFLGGGVCINSNWSISTGEKKINLLRERCYELLRLSDLRAPSILFIALLWLNIIFQLLYCVFSVGLLILSSKQHDHIVNCFWGVFAVWGYKMKPQSSLSCLSASVFTWANRGKEQSSNNQKLLFPLSPPIFLKPWEKSPVGSSCWLSLVFCLQTR